MSTLVHKVDIVNYMAIVETRTVQSKAGKEEVMNSKVWFIAGSSLGLGRVWAEAALTRGDKVAASARKAEDVADLKENSAMPSCPWRWTSPVPSRRRPRFSMPLNTSAGWISC